MITCNCSTCQANAKAIGATELRATFTPTQNTPFNPNRKADRHAIVFYANSPLAHHQILANKFGMAKA